MSSPRDQPAAATSRGRELRWSWLGRRSYGEVFELQEEVRRRVRFGLGPERFFLLEHPPVFTLGRNASAADIVADSAWLDGHGVEVFESNRGGQVTYHGPGQLVGYPIVDLKPDRRDIGRYVRDLQEVLIRGLGDHGIEATRRAGKGNIGVWVGDFKIASIGVHLARWITIHGFALNVSTALENFAGIVACGLPDVTMTSMAELNGAAPDLEDLATTIVGHFADVFERHVVVESIDGGLPALDGIDGQEVEPHASG